MSEASALPKGPTKEEREARLDAVLVRLGYPSIAELRAAGELRSEESDENQEEEDWDDEE
jgi:hypothetical protein